MKKRPIVVVVMLCLMTFFAGTTYAADPIKVGAPLPLTGAYAADGLGYLRGIETALRELNGAGGLLGKPLELVKFDTQELSPERVMQAADELIVKRKVDSVHGGWAGWGQDVRAYGKYDVPFMMWDASINAISVFRENPERYANVFQLNDIESNHAISVFSMLQNLPIDYPNKTIATISADDSWGMETSRGMKEIAEKNGWKVVVAETVPYGTREWRPILTKIRKTKPAIIYMEIVSSPDLVTFFHQFQKNPTPSLIHLGYGVSLPDFMATMGKGGNGVMGLTTGMPGPKAPTADAQAWVDRFKKEYDAEPSAGSFAVYSGVMMWADAVKAVGDVKNFKAINDYLANHQFENVIGQKVWFDQDHKISTLKCWPLSHLQIQDGQLATIYHGQNKYLDYQFITPSWMK